MKREAKKTMHGAACAAFLIILAAATQFSIGGCKPKTDQEKIRDALNGYFKAQASGDYRASYRFLAPEVQRKVGVDLWVKAQSENLNSVRLMRQPRLSDIVINGNEATAVLNYMGIPSKVLSAAVSQAYSNNFTLPMDQLVREVEKDLIDNFDKLKEPQTMPLTFVRTEDGWKLFLELKGESYERK